MHSNYNKSQLLNEIYARPNEHFFNSFERNFFQLLYVTQCIKYCNSMHSEDGVEST